MKKSSLPKDWIVVNSTSYPDRVYYFNVKTNKASWEEPLPEKNMAPPKKATNPKKRKKPEDDEDDNSSQTRPTTPELDIPKQPNERPKLHAKRSTAAQKEQVETPQMRELREKMLQRQAKASTQKKAVSKQQIEPAETVDTPQMRELREKLLQRQAQGSAAKKSSQLDVTDKNVAGKSMQEKPQLRRPKSIVPKKTTSPVISKPEETVKEQAKESTDDTGSTCPKRQKIPSVLKKIEPIKTPVRRRDQKSITPGEPVKELSVKLVDIHDISKKTTQTKSRPSSVSRRIPVVVEQATSSKDVQSYDSNNDPYRPLTSTSGKRKNIAKERLDTLTTSLQKKREKKVLPTIKSIKRLSHGTAVTVQENDDSNEADELPDLYKNAEARLKNLRDRVLQRHSVAGDLAYKIPKKEDSRPEQRTVQHTTVETLLDEYRNEQFCEEMEWEPIEDEKIMDEVQAVRTELWTDTSARPFDDLPSNVLEIPAPANKAADTGGRELYIVIDTNVFLSNLQAVEQARDAIFKSYGRPIIVVPWTVLRELDYIKDDKSKTRPLGLQAKARRAVRFLNQHFSAKHPRIKGQTPADVAKNKELFAVECPDDEILQSCLQIRNSKRSVVMLSYDKNLCNKAMIHDIVVLGKNDPFEKIDYLNAIDIQAESPTRVSLQSSESLSSESAAANSEAEHEISDDIYEEAKAVLKSFLSVIVAKEMENLFGDHWEKHAIILPPWSALDVLKCAVKHWIAAVSESFVRRGEPILRELLEVFKLPQEGHRKLKDVLIVVERCYDLIQTVKVDKYPDLMTRSAQSIEVLKNKCLENMKRIREERLARRIGVEDDSDREEERAMNALKCFNDIYEYSRTVCGLMSELEGLPFHVVYKRPNPLPPVELIRQKQPELAAHLNRLVSALRDALEKINGQFIEHRDITTLYHTLTNFPMDASNMTSINLAPIDLRCCLKKKEQSLRTGLGQLQELSEFLCHVAKIKCT